MYALEAKEMCKRVERICQVDPDGWYAPVIGQELVRCKDCKKFVIEEDETYCEDMFGQCGENGFCAWAERKEE